MQSVESNKGFAKRGFAPWTDHKLRPLLRLENISKRFGTFTAVDQLSLDIYQGEFFALLAPSGCGKTTLLRSIAGFEQPNCGRILHVGDARGDFGLGQAFLLEAESDIGFDGKVRK